MKWLGIALLCILLGIATSYSIAWYICHQYQTSYGGSTNSFGLDIDHRGQREGFLIQSSTYEKVHLLLWDRRKSSKGVSATTVEDTWQEIRSYVSNGIARDKTIDELIANAVVKPSKGGAGKSGNVLIDRLRAGWPCICVTHTKLMYYDQKTNASQVIPVEVETPSISFTRVKTIAGFPAPLTNHIRLPLTPLLPGMLINTAFFTIAWALLGAITIFASRALIRRFGLRRLRRSQGLCESCAYDLRGTSPNSPCPECGRLRSNLQVAK